MADPKASAPVLFRFQRVYSQLSNARWNLEQALKSKEYPKSEKDQRIINAHANICEAMRIIEE